MIRQESKTDLQKLNKQRALRGSNPQHRPGSPPPGQGRRGAAGGGVARWEITAHPYGDGPPGPAAGLWMTTATAPAAGRLPSHGPGTRTELPGVSRARPASRSSGHTRWATVSL